MKKLTLILFLFIVAIACKNEVKDYVSVAGTLKNNKDSILNIIGRTGIAKTIKINEDGSFKDTLKVEKADVYTLQSSTGKRAPIFLKNGFDIQLTGDSNDFLKSFSYKGIGADNSNFMLAQIKETQNLGNPQLILELEEDVFKLKMENLKRSFDSIVNSYDNLDSTMITMANTQTEQMVSYFKQNYNSNKKMAKGSPSPKFEDYVDFKGGKKSLDSFKGKYVYIDVWATWCGPCIQQIPFLKQIEEEYKGKNIEFVSISTDESRRSGGSWEAAEKKWRDFVKAKQLGGVQLWSGEDYSFQQAYQITGIPRFILIDPNGNIVDANAPRPMEPRLKTLFNSLGI
ncbi:TlpA disulfide reductase family protein [uncultured Polaribacter sp.]|uniref:TlpA family protein disulfide reductase n=1 Tax=uncultured Polaribacter sp. TaxID=174711 RepID=UPI00261A4625|nr:TlpA disulfide reductase family protein [uncultured Polaribacter sp.]